MGKKIMSVVLLFFTMTCLSACGRGRQEGSYSYNIYYVNKEGTRVVSEEYVTDTSAENKEELLQEFIQILSDTAERPEYLSPLTEFYQGYALNEGQINLDFDEGYIKQDPIVEVLCRAAVVRTMTQIDGIDTVTFSVQGEALVDAIGIPVGAMTADSFIDNAGTEINAYVETEFRLYFANETGDALTEVSRNVIYNSNISMEQQVVEELIKGPQENDVIGNEAGYPTVNPAVTILGVTVRDRVCYVNLSEEFLTPVHNVTSQVALYSIVNSLVELPGVNKVQISIDGNTDVTFLDSISLTTVFERDLDIIE